MAAAVVAITALNLKAHHNALGVLPSRANPAKWNQSQRINPIFRHFCCGRFAPAFDGETAPAELV